MPALFDDRFGSKTPISCRCTVQKHLPPHRICAKPQGRTLKILTSKPARLPQGAFQFHPSFPLPLLLLIAEATSGSAKALASVSADINFSGKQE